MYGGEHPREDTMEHGLVGSTPSNRQDTNSPLAGRSPHILRLVRSAAKLSGTWVPVLLQGETGTGKEVLARLLHEQDCQSGERTRPFVVVNCAALPENLVESILFGHERGAFTGACGRQIGKFEQANGGDIFLDEINSLPFALQAKLLRVIEERRFERLGCKQSRLVQFRVLSASNANLSEEVERGYFRRDLFFRLSTITLSLPPLRERREDIPCLIERFMKEDGGRDKAFTPAALRKLLAFPWPGNVRELRHVVRQCLILTEGPMIDVDDLPKRVVEGCSMSLPIWSANGSPSGSPLHCMERQLISQVLRKHRWNKTRASQELGIARTTLYRRMQQLGMALQSSH